MKQAIHFMYDGISSKDMNVHIAWNKSGLFEENFLPERKIIEKKIAHREKPYFQRVEHEPLSFDLSFAITEWDETTLKKISEWFFQPYYKPLVFDTNPNRVFHAIFEGEPKLIHNGVKEGYVELTIRCDSPYGYSHEITKTKIEMRNSNTGSEVKLDQSNFNSGTFDNTKLTANGVTLDQIVSTWGSLYSISSTWGGIT